jgi:(1->4)-alpha-D-glucan 1-alpha-D-glucosylmutase
VSRELLGKLARLCGIEVEYVGADGVHHRAPAQTQRSLLAAMGIAAGTTAELRTAIAERELAPWRRFLPAVKVFGEGRSTLEVGLNVPRARAGDRFRWALREANDQHHYGELQPNELPMIGERAVDGVSIGRYLLQLPQVLDPGYHRLELATGDDEATSMALVITPASCFLPEALQSSTGVWGPEVPLHALRRPRDWGVGDFTSLRYLVELSATLGADVVGITPLHALFLHSPGDASPYRPSSRLFLNVLYLDVEAVPELAECATAREKAQVAEFVHHLEALRQQSLTDWSGVAAAKLRVLELLYDCFRMHHLEGHTDRAASFHAFCEAGGERLYQYALFEALQEYFQATDPRVRGWRAWPPAYHHPASLAVTEFADAHPQRIQFYEYLQWLAHSQLAAVGKRSLELGLGVGLYQDMALQVDPGGADVWANADLYARGVAVGAPPDATNPEGQRWGLAPAIPERLAAAAYAPFIAVLQSNMRHVGALRIGLVGGLPKTYWVPEGATAAEGAYVRYPGDDLLGLVALESQRNACLVIGEAQSQLPEATQAAIEPMGVLSRELFYFTNDEGGLKPPAAYPTQALVAVRSHNLPTLRGLWVGRDLALRTRIGGFPSEAVRRQSIRDRAHFRTELLLALEAEGLLPDGVSADPASCPEWTPALSHAVHVYLARTPSKIFMVQLGDVLGELDQVSLPGSAHQYPNWRGRLPEELRDVFAEGRVQDLAEALRALRGPLRGSLPSTAAVAASAPIPRATYRLQFNRQFTFADAAALVPYFAELGVSHCYASPYLRSRSGSTHGYDIIDHGSLNPELGTLAEFDAFVAALHTHRMGQILDVVPNHMGVGGSDNAWWLDVLENGQASAYAEFFDIDWEPVKEELRNRLLLPNLGDHYGAVLERGELVLKFDPAQGEFSVFYYDHRCPIDPRTYARILGLRTDRLALALGPDHPLLFEYESLVTSFDHLPRRSASRSREVLERQRDKEICKRHLVRLWESSEEIRKFIEGTVRDFNGTPGKPASFDLLHRLLEDQAYRVAFWRVASQEINYRRFFDINELAGLRMEVEEVFHATQRFTLDLLHRGAVEGLRVDHPDGLYDPRQYVERLVRETASVYRAPVSPESTPEPALGPSPYLVLEKILAVYERLPEDWPVHGTTGYEFANQVNGLLVYPGAEEAMDAIYAEFIGHRLEFDELLYQCKKLIMQEALSSELNVLATELNRISESDRHTRDFTLNGLRDGLMEVVACFPVYRTYVSQQRVSAEDRRYVDWAVAQAKKRNPEVDVGIFDFIRAALLLDLCGKRPAVYQERVRRFAIRFQQYSAPVMAKGMEDTAFYIYNRLVSMNDVGGDPRRFGLSVSAFHHANQERSKNWPHSMLCTSTHDSKRSEDVRARIAVLSELADEWQEHVQRWQRVNQGRKAMIDQRPAPSANDEYLLYQTLLGAWPLEAFAEDAQLSILRERIDAYMLKAVREAKVDTSWMNPSAEYEQALASFVAALLETGRTNPFLTDFLPFARQVAWWGLYNSLSQVLLKLISPGVPDIYQGNELWDFSLVDPDNRRPVDYRYRRERLGELQSLMADTNERAERVRGLLDTLEDGRAKLFLTWQALLLRARRPLLFEQGEYLPLASEGTKKEHICAFIRMFEGDMVIAIAPRWFATLTGDLAQRPLGEAIWEDTTITVPPECDGRALEDVLTGTLLYPDNSAASGPRLAASEALAHFPVGLLWCGASDGARPGS